MTPPSPASPMPTLSSVQRNAISRSQDSRKRKSTLKAFGYAVVASRPDYILVILPTTLALKTFYSDASGEGGLFILASFALVLSLLVFAAFSRSADTRFEILSGPLILFFGACAIVLTRPSRTLDILEFILVGVLVLRLVKTVDARKITSSLIDGIGLYALVNVVAYFAGLRSPAESEGWRLFLFSEGLSRIVFPLSTGLNVPPVMAVIYITSVLFVCREPGLRRRVFRATCFAAALVVLIGSGTRVPAVAALLLTVTAIFVPTAVRWIAPLSVIFASSSAVVLSGLVSLTQSILNPIVTAISDRPESRQGLNALNGRDLVWEHALNFWQSEVDNAFNILLGYGMLGHYRSGVSLTYYQLVSHVIIRDPERVVSVHNSFLQQLFDGGVLGWIFLTLALLWASVRFAKRWDLRTAGDLRGYATAASMAVSVILICSTTEVLLHPGIITFYVVMILVGVACQGRLLEDQPGEGGGVTEPTATKSNVSAVTTEGRSDSRPQR